MLGRRSQATVASRRARAFSSFEDVRDRAQERPRCCLQGLLRKQSNRSLFRHLLLRENVDANLD